MRKNAVAFADRFDSSGGEQNGGGLVPSTGANGFVRKDSIVSASATEARRTEPPILKREHIEEYQHSELDRLLDWVISDGRLRSDQEIGQEMFSALGFRRHGARIDNAIKDAVRRYHYRSK